MASKTLGRFILKTFGVLAFCAVSAYALFLAYGYNLDIKHRNIEKTSIIDLASRYDDVRVYLDDKIIGNGLPLQIKDLLPGFYDLSVVKLGYLPWRRQIEVQTDIVSKIEDVVLVPEHADTLIGQLVHFPENSRYFFGKDFFIVTSEGHDYLTMVHLLDDGKMKEEELKLARSDIRDIRIFDSQKFLVTFEDDTHEWVEFNGPRFVDFTLPAGAGGLTVLPNQNAVFFLHRGDLYRVATQTLATLTAKSVLSAPLLKNVDQFDVHEGKLVYLSGGFVYSADIDGKNIRLVDRSGNAAFIRYIPSNTSYGGLYVVKTRDDKRLLYTAPKESAPGTRGFSTLLTPQLKGEVQEDGAGRFLFADESGNIFLYKPLTEKKILVTTLPTDFTLLGFLFGDGHFLFARQEQLFLADSSFTNVYPLTGYRENGRYFSKGMSLFFFADHKLKSLSFLVKR